MQTGETVEGLLPLGSDELTVLTKENQEKTVPVKYIKSITLEKTPDPVPGGDPKREPTYSVRLENSQEIYTLRKKYTFSLNTNLGMVTKTIDPDQVNRLFSKDSSSGVRPGRRKIFHPGPKRGLQPGVQILMKSTSFPDALRHSLPFEPT